MRDTIRILRRGRVVELEGVDPNQTLLDHLRLNEARCGTKEGCAEGDCGACTVAVGRVEDGRVVYRPVNSCIQLTASLDGTEVVTVDDLSEAEGGLHPVQRAMVEKHGSQCGFCTPGFVMSLFTLYQSGIEADRPTVNDWISGNLCRCTGYRPIVEAALESCGGMPEDSFARRRDETARLLAGLQDGEDLFVGTQDRFFASPASIGSLADLHVRHPDATLVAGATDVGLWITKQLRDLPKVIHLGRVAGLDAVTETDADVTFGATCTYEKAQSVVARLAPDLAELWRRIGSRQVRAAGTVGGNIANGSPIGDTPPALIALDATLVLQKGAARRELPLEDFFVAYGRQDRAPGEFVREVRVPRPGRDQVFHAYKVSKRYDQDITAVLGAFRLTLDGRRIAAARIAYGGMAATPKRAPGAEAALVGASLDRPESWEAALAALAGDYTPLTDMRASAAYRREVAGALLRRALIETSGMPQTQTRVHALGGAA